MNRSIYWVHLGRALARLRGRQDDAVRALRTAEDLHPTLVRRHPMARDAIAMLLPGARRDTIGTELRRMAHRAGLPIQPIRGVFQRRNPVCGRSVTICHCERRHRDRDR